MVEPGVESRFNRPQSPLSERPCSRPCSWFTVPGGSWSFQMGGGSGSERGCVGPPPFRPWEEELGQWGLPALTIFPPPARAPLGWPPRSSWAPRGRVTSCHTSLTMVAGPPPSQGASHPLASTDPRKPLSPPASSPLLRELGRGRWAGRQHTALLHEDPAC